MLAGMAASRGKLKRSVRPRPHQQQCRSNIRHCRKNRSTSSIRHCCWHGRGLMVWRPSVCPANTQRDSLGGSTRRGERKFPSEYYEDGHRPYLFVMHFSSQIILKRVTDIYACSPTPVNYHPSYCKK